MPTDVLAAEPQAARTEAQHSSAVPERTNDVACGHCGLPVPLGLQRDDANTQFCCASCETVFSLLHGHGLAQFYSFAERVQTPQVSGASYESFDHPAFQSLYVRPNASGMLQTELYLENIHCASCVWLIERVPLLLPGVARAELNMQRSQAVVEWDPAAISLSTVARMLDSLGYPSHPFRGAARDELRRRESRAMLARIGVAGAIAINVMLASLALYSGEQKGMEIGYRQLFRWISLALTTVSLAWPGRVFFTGAWTAFRARALHMDVPIALALSVGVVQGAVNTVSDNGPVYFDGLAVLIFALLAGRFLQQRGQRLATDSAELLYALAPSSATVVDGASVREVPSVALLPGMVLSVRAGESFAADGVVTAGTSSINAALLTGESQPTRVKFGDTVYAGTLNVDSPLQVTVSEAGESSRLARLLQQVEATAARRAPVVLLANRLAGIFTAVVLGVAAVVLAVKLHYSPEHALDDTIALLIVTCPCALALATPLAITVAIGRAAKDGILVKGGDALELLAGTGTLVLDKTGTLTEGKTMLASWVGPHWVQPMVHALEVGSSHPLAAGFRRAWGDTCELRPSETQHVSGCGIFGVVNGAPLRVGSPNWVLSHATSVSPEAQLALTNLSSTLTPVLVAVGDTVVACAGLGDAVRADALTSLQRLRRLGWRTVMLSGDGVNVANAVGTSLQFSDDEIFGARSPEQKLAFIEARRSEGGCVVMVGDGVNDAAAMAAATVGIGVHGGAEACLANADVHLTRPGLAVLLELMEGTRRTRRLIVRNITFSVVYNLVGSGLAIAGVLTPLVAALLMPASSITVILNSWWGRTFAERTRARS